MESYKREYDKVVKDLDKIRNNISKLKEHAKDKIAHAHTSHEKRKIMDAYKKKMFDMKYDKNLKEKFSKLRKRKKELERLINASESHTSMYKNTTESRGTKINNILDKYNVDSVPVTSEPKSRYPTCKYAIERNSNQHRSSVSEMINRITERNCTNSSSSSNDIGGSSDYKQTSSTEEYNHTNTNCNTNYTASADICRIKLSKTEQKALKAYYNYLLKLKEELEK